MQSPHNFAESECVTASVGQLRQQKTTSSFDQGCSGAGTRGTAFPSFLRQGDASPTFWTEIRKPLVNCTHVIPSSAAECERGFSHMNIIVSDTRSMLLVSHVSSLLFIKLHGLPLKSWNPTRYAKTWLRKHRSATDTQTRVAVSQDKTKDPLCTCI